MSVLAACGTAHRGDTCYLRWMDDLPPALQWSRRHSAPILAPMLRPLPLSLFALALASCKSMSDTASPWSPEFDAPRLITTPRIRLEPLQPKFNDLDYKAAQGSRDHLRTTLQWGSWPSPDMTADQNRGDLERHWQEFERREAYAYTVLHPSGTPCIGCVYLNADKQNTRGLRMAYWVVEDQLANGLDEHVVATVLGNVEAAWPVDQVTISHPVQNPRGIKILERRGLEMLGRKDGNVTFVWKR